VDTQVVSSSPPQVRSRARLLDYPVAPQGMEAVETLIWSVPELRARLPAAAADSEMSRMRIRVTNSLAAAKATVAGNVARVTERTDSLATVDARVRECPRIALALAALLGLAAGLSVNRSDHRRQRRFHSLFR